MSRRLPSARPQAAGDVWLELRDAQFAGSLRPAEGEDYKYGFIVMPMRI